MLLTGRIRPAKSSMTGAYSSLLALRYNLHPCHTVDHFVCVCVCVCVLHFYTLWPAYCSQNCTVYLRQRMRCMLLPVFVCLSVCLSVSKITQKRVHGFG